MAKRIAWLIGFALGAAVVATWLLWWAPGPKAGPHTVVVKEGASLSSVANQLAEEGIVPGTATTYRIMARLLGSGDPVQAGEFSIPEGLGGNRVLDVIQHGQPVQRLLTVTEGMPS